MSLNPEHNLLILEMRKALAEQFEMERVGMESRMQEIAARQCSCPIIKNGRQGQVNRILDFIEDVGAGEGINGGINRMRRNHLWIERMRHVSDRAAGIAGTVIIGAGLGAAWMIMTSWDKIVSILRG